MPDSAGKNREFSQVFRPSPSRWSINAIIWVF